MELRWVAEGELEGDARARAEKLVAENEDARRALDGFRAPHVGLWLSESFDRRANVAGADAIADRVMAELSGEVPASAKVVRIGEGRSGAAAPATAMSRGGGGVAPRRGLLVVSP